MNLRTVIQVAAFLSVSLAQAGCSTTSGVIVNNSAQKVHYNSVYVIVHGGNSSDMDAKIQKEFLRHGFAVSAGPEGSAPAATQLIARYADDWRWDLAMYLRSLDVMLYDRQSNTLLAQGSWKNSVFHGFHSSEKVVTGVVDDTLSKINSQL
jgi:hypothetical protein